MTCITGNFKTIHIKLVVHVKFVVVMLRKATLLLTVIFQTTCNLLLSKIFSPLMCNLGCQYLKTTDFSIFRKQYDVKLLKQ